VRDQGREQEKPVGTIWDGSEARKAGTMDKDIMNMTSSQPRRLRTIPGGKWGANLDSYQSKSSNRLFLLQYSAIRSIETTNAAQSDIICRMRS
jgi:hypothetical protein